MMEEVFAEGVSAVHRCNPVIRVVLATLYSFTVALTDDLMALGLSLIFSVGLAALAQLPLRPLAKRLATAGGLLLLVWALLPWTYAGDPLAQIGPLLISRQGVGLCVQITLKTMAILIAFTALLASMHLATLGHALYVLGLPTKLIHLLMLAYRYIYVIEQEYQRLYRAAKMRNFRPAGDLHTYKTFAYLVGMLFVRASERAQRVHLAMTCRGFDGRRFHTLKHYAATAWNPVLSIAVIAICSLLTVFEVFLG